MKITSHLWRLFEHAYELFIRAKAVLMYTDTQPSFGMVNMTLSMTFSFLLSTGLCQKEAGHQEFMGN